MENKINRLNEIYRDEINSIVNKVSPARSNTEDKSINFGSFLNDSFDVTDFDDYNNYVDMMNQVEQYNPKLASNIEKYLTKEINLMTLLALHVSVLTRGENTPSLEDLTENLD